MKSYLELCRRVIDEGVWVENARTGKRCLTVINADLVYDVSDRTLPVLTTKKMQWKAAIAEMLGYLRGYTSAAQFRAIGCNTWNANANDNEEWLNNPFRTGEDDMGRCYGAQGRDWRNPEGMRIDQLRNVYDDLRQGIDNRCEIMTFMNPGERDRACLNACMHTHTFSILEDRLYLTSYQRSDDLPLGHGFNQVQVGWLLMVMAKITGLRAATAYHKIVNVHIYEDQVELMRDVQLIRAPFPLPKLVINPAIKTLEDLETWVTPDDFELEGYRHHPGINYPFSV
ncbi:MAG: thymidylate synthase [Desulfofustis sp. PB-SRB1]|jgi:thymidylate synthase|nr:thymidylate synthase [Desulfofustis sp. PB-SRB1]MBM1001917.1 thymidylate synthase [Desulfofustis sp. PB-SRB1]HBH27750.1 thymidylate synthase [Desulfofustis sp.]HBH32269.1 thymidylate synthase [Desulfofustis sp.]